MPTVPVWWWSTIPGEIPGGTNDKPPTDDGGCVVDDWLTPSSGLP